MTNRGKDTNHWFLLGELRRQQTEMKGNKREVFNLVNIKGFNYQQFTAQII